MGIGLEADIPIWQKLLAPVDAGSAQTNDGGEYRFSNLAPGRYILQARDLRPSVNNRYGSRPNSLYVPAYYPSAPNQRQAAPVDVAVGADVRGIDIRLFKVARPRSVHIRGKVMGVAPDSQVVVSVGLASIEEGSWAAAPQPGPFPRTIRSI